MIYDIKYVDLLNGNAFEYPEFLYHYVNYDYEFVHPNSAFTFEFKKEIKSNKLILCFDVSQESNINEIVILGK